MNYDAILKATSGNFYHKAEAWELETVEHIVAGDLMSDVLTVEEDKLMMVTSLATDQVVRTADFVGAKSILLVNGKKPSESLLKLAAEGSITIMGTKLRMFETCSALGAII